VAEEEKEFKVPPAFGDSEVNQEPTPKVDNFSPPQEESDSSDSLKMPEQPLKTSSNEEVEDVFAKPQSSKPEPEVKPQAGGQKLNIPSENKSKGCCWGIVIIIVIILLLTGTIFVNEWGILNLGIEKYYGAIRLEKLWGGLPLDSKAALADSFNKMKGKSFKLEGSTKADLFLTSSQDSALGVWDEDLDLQGEVKINAKIQNKDKMELNFATEVSSDSTAVNNLLAGDSAIDLTTIYDSSDIYLKSETLKNIMGLDKDWLEIKSMSSSSEETKSASKLADLAVGGERISFEKVNGVACYVYQLKINSPAFQIYLDNNLPAISWLARGVSYQSIKFYLGKRDHLIYKLEVSANNSLEDLSLGNKLVINFKDIGSNIQITLPSSEEIIEKDWKEVKSAFISDSSQERDKQRKADLKKIQDALLAYKVQNGNYPSTLGLVEKTKDETSNLKNALVPKFIDSLPLDPMTDKYYYGYKSVDGSSCEITSILEVKTDPEGEEIGSYWIYKIKGN